MVAQGCWRVEAARALEKLNLPRHVSRQMKKPNVAQNAVS